MVRDEPFDTDCSTAFVHSHWTRWPRPSTPSRLSPRTRPWFAEAAAASTSGVRSAAQAEHLAFARVERANIDAALAWSAHHDPLLAVRIANGFGWAWVVLGDSRGAQRILAALEAAGDMASVHDRAEALLLAAWIEASTDRLELAHDHIAAATELADAIDDVDLQARCCYYLAYVVSHHGEFRQALELTDRSDALYDGLDRPWDQAANWLFAARAAISAGDHERSVAARRRGREVAAQRSTIPGSTYAARPIRGELARIQHRFDDAVRAPRASRGDIAPSRLPADRGVPGRQPRAGPVPGRRLRTLAPTNLALAIDKAEATGDVRMAALARVHLGRVLRALDQTGRARVELEAAAAWHRSAGGGEQAALGECLLAAMDAADRVAEPKSGLPRSSTRRDSTDHAHVEVFALDALARIAAAAGDVGTSARTLRGG